VKGWVKEEDVMWEGDEGEGQNRKGDGGEEGPKTKANTVGL